MNEERFFIFADTYRLKLQEAILAFPEEYPWVTKPTTIHGNTGVTVLPPATPGTISTRILEAVRRNSFNKDGRAFKATCKALGIKHTYKAIDEYLER